VRIFFVLHILASNLYFKRTKKHKIFKYQQKSKKEMIRKCFYVEAVLWPRINNKSAEDNKEPRYDPPDLYKVLCEPRYGPPGLSIRCYVSLVMDLLASLSGVM
jgi:hypothetical protein